jgi:hypothetical protein
MKSDIKRIYGEGKIMKEKQLFPPIIANLSRISFKTSFFVHMKCDICSETGCYDLV